MFSWVNTEIKPKQRAVFIHVPRTGGIALSRHIYPYGARMFLAHATASFVRDNLGRLAWDRLFTFGFVRNPWARVVSWFLTYLRYTENRKPPGSMPFETFVRSPGMMVGSFAHNGWLEDLEITWSQKLFLCTGDEIIVDFIGKYEQFDKDVKFICDKLDIPPLVRKKNENSNYDYRDYYDDSTRDLIAKRAEWEIKRFKYEFEEA